MDNETKSIIQEQFKLLPKVIQDTILNSNWQEKIRRVVKNNSLHVDQGAAIENLVLITMLGIETPENFVQNAKEYAEISEEQAYTISNEVEREIFSNIRKKLIEIIDTKNTVDDVERVTNELSRVADDISKEAQSLPEKEVKTSLKEKIPSNSFSTSTPKLNKLPPVPEIKKESQIPVSTVVKNIAEQQEAKPEIQINTELQKVISDNIESVKPAESINDFGGVSEPAVSEEKKVVEKQIFTPMPKTLTPPAPQDISIKIDPYREPIE